MPKPLARLAQNGLFWRVLIACAIVAAFVLVWHFTPLSRIAKPQALVEHIESISRQRWAPVYFIAAYVFGGLIMVRAFWHHPSLTGVLLIVAVALVWMGLAFGLQRWVSGRKPKTRKSPHARRAMA